MDIPTRREGEEFGDRKSRSGEYPSVEDLLQSGARTTRAHDSGAPRGDDAWREDARRKIDEGFEECLRGELIDGDVVFERLRRRLEALRRDPS